MPQMTHFEKLFRCRRGNLYNQLNLNFKKKFLRINSLNNAVENDISIYADKPSKI